MMKHIIMYGMGTLANYLTSHLKQDTHILAYALDFGFGSMINGIPIINIKTVNEYRYDYIVVGFSDISAGRRHLRRLCVPEEKIVCYMPTSDYTYMDELDRIMNNTLISETHNDIIPELFTLDQPSYKLCGMSTHPIYNNIVRYDYVREQTLALISEQIVRKAVGGVIAELGVYRGEFSRKINTVFPDRKLFLFDTFDGFSEKEVKADHTLLDAGAEMEKWHDTSVDIVLSQLPHVDKVIVKKGYFPETYDLENDIRFAFVSIDVDLYDPIYAGLSVFYPRLSVGGYIMIHDYNSGGYAGTHEAVDKYCCEKNISCVPIPDSCGTVVITK